MKINYDMLFLFGILVIGLLIASFFGFREGLTDNKSGETVESRNSFKSSMI